MGFFKKSVEEEHLECLSSLNNQPIDSNIKSIDTSIRPTLKALAAVLIADVVLDVYLILVPMNAITLQ